MTFGDRCACIHPRTPAPIDAASAPLVTIAATAPTHTSRSAFGNFNAIPAAVSCPTSPHSEKKMAANDTPTARDAGYCLISRLSGFRHSTMAIAIKLIAVIKATSHGGRCEMNLLTYTATPIFNINARAMPHRIGAVLYRVARTPVVYRSLSPTISATNTVPYVARIIGSIGPESLIPLREPRGIGSIPNGNRTGFTITHGSRARCLWGRPPGLSMPDALDNRAATVRERTAGESPANGRHRPSALKWGHTKQ